MSEVTVKLELARRPLENALRYEDGPSVPINVEREILERVLDTSEDQPKDCGGSGLVSRPAPSGKGAQGVLSDPCPGCNHPDCPTQQLALDRLAAEMGREHNLLDSEGRPTPTAYTMARKRLGPDCPNRKEAGGEREKGGER